MRFDKLPHGAIFVRIGPKMSPVFRKSGTNAAEIVRGVDPERKIISRDERTIPADTTVQRVDPLSILGKPAL